MHSSSTPVVSPSSSYLLLFRDASGGYRRLSPEQRQHLLAQWNDWYDRLAAAGKVQHGHPLEGTGRIVSRRGHQIVDGPFVEAKETVGGYFFLSVDSLEEAVEIAKQCPSLNHDLDFDVEVRPVADTCPALRANASVTAGELTRA
jgi:hypothetical protein